jgi:hypothetical protein
MTLVIDGDEDRVHDQVQAENARREREQLDLARVAKVRWLDQDGIDYQEYRRRRAATVIVEPGLPLDEMSYQDYKAAREMGAGADDLLSDCGEPVVKDYQP